MKILVLHGFGQSTQIVQQRGKALFKHLQKLEHELTFPEGHIDVQLFNQDGSIRQEGKAWFAYNKDPNIFLEEMNQQETEWIGIEKTFQQLQSKVFDVIIGFSQGAAVAIALAKKLKPKKLVILSGFVRPEPTNWKLENVECPVLMIWDPSETIVLKESLESVRNWCDNLTEMTHNKRHSIPSTTAVRKRIVEFLDS